MDYTKKASSSEKPPPIMRTDSDHREKMQSELRHSKSPAPPFVVAKHAEILESQLGLKDLLKVGSGTYGTVFLATDIKSSTEGQVAVKVVSCPCTTSTAYSDYWLNRCKREVHFMEQLQGHPNIVALLGHAFLGHEIDAPQGHPLYVAIKMERLSRDLADVTDYHVMSWSEMERVAKQIASAIVWMHDRAIVHHDIKPGNLMAHPLPPKTAKQQLSAHLLEANYKLIDFNLARHYSTERGQTREYRRCGGTEGYRCPEKEAASPTTPYNPFSADDYAFAATMVALLLGGDKFHEQLEDFEHVVLILQQRFGNLLSTEQHQVLHLYQGLFMLLVNEGSRISVKSALERFTSS